MEFASASEFGRWSTPNDSGPAPQFTAPYGGGYDLSSPSVASAAATGRVPKQVRMSPLVATSANNNANANTNTTIAEHFHAHQQQLISSEHGMRGLPHHRGGNSGEDHQGETAGSRELNAAIAGADPTRLRFWVRKLREELVLEASWARHRDLEFERLSEAFNAQRGELLLAQAILSTRILAAAALIQRPRLLLVPLHGPTPTTW